LAWCFTEPVGALIALKLTHNTLSVSSFLGLLALLGVSVQTAVILVSYINKLRLEAEPFAKHSRSFSASPSSIMMTALVACLACSPPPWPPPLAATPKTFRHRGCCRTALRLILGFFVNPVLYEVAAAKANRLQV